MPVFSNESAITNATACAELFDKAQAVTFSSLSWGSPPHFLIKEETTKLKEFLLQSRRSDPFPPPTASSLCSGHLARR